MRVLQKLILLVTLVSYAGNARAETPTAAAPRPAAGIEPEQKPHVVPIPAIYYTPETELAYGAVLMMLYPSNHPRRVSKFQPSLIHTTRNQVLAHLLWTHYFDSYRLSTVTQFGKFPDLFYGIGIDSRVEDEEEYTPLYFDNDVTVDWLVNEHCSIGIGHSYKRYEIVQQAAAGFLDRGDVAGSDDSIAVGGLTKISYDTRDNGNSARRGTLIDLQASRYEKALGGLRSFSLFEVDLRKYFPLSDEVAVANKLSSEWTSGDTPFRQLSRLGGVNLMRGLYSGRFRDRARVSLQSEVRFPIRERFSGTAFLAAGTVAPSLRELTTSELKTTGGGGLRFALIPEKRVNLRLDVGFSEDGHGIYFSLNEAF